MSVTVSGTVDAEITPFSSTMESLSDEDSGGHRQREIYEQLKIINYAKRHERSRFASGRSPLLFLAA